MFSNIKSDHKFFFLFLQTRSLHACCHFQSFLPLFQVLILCFLLFVHFLLSFHLIALPFFAALFSQIIVFFSQAHAFTSVPSYLLFAFFFSFLHFTLTLFHLWQTFCSQSVSLFISFFALFLLQLLSSSHQTLLSLYS